MSIDDVDLRRSFIIELPEEEIQQAIEFKLRGAANGASAPKGFRKERLPITFVIAKYGEEFISKVLQELLQVRLDATLAALNHPVAGGINVKGIWSKWDRPLRYRYEVSYETMPTITLQGLDKLVINRPKPTVIDDAQLDTFIEMTRRQHALWRDSANPSVSGNRIIIDFNGRLDDDPLQPFPGGTANGIAVELGAGGMLEDFEVQLIGLQPGEEVDFPVIFPTEYKPDFLAGKFAHFHVKVIAVHEMQLPPLDESFAVKVGVAEGGMAAVRAKLREHLERQHLEQDQRDLGNSILLQFLEANEIPLPNCLVEMNLIAIHSDKAQDLHIAEHDVQITEAMVAVARQRTKIGVLIQHLMLHEGLALDPESPLEPQVIAWLISRAEDNALSS